MRSSEPSVLREDPFRKSHLVSNLALYNRGPWRRRRSADLITPKKKLVAQSREVTSVPRKSDTHTNGTRFWYRTGKAQPSHNKDFTFMNVSKDVDLGLDSPLDGVQELHASNTLHLLWDPVQEACTRQGVRKAARRRRRRRSHFHFHFHSRKTPLQRSAWWLFCPNFHLHHRAMHHIQADSRYCGAVVEQRTAHGSTKHRLWGKQRSITASRPACVWRGWSTESLWFSGCLVSAHVAAAESIKHKRNLCLQSVGKQTEKRLNKAVPSPKGPGQLAAGRFL